MRRWTLWLMLVAIGWCMLSAARGNAQAPEESSTAAATDTAVANPAITDVLQRPDVFWPILILVLGITIVLGLIIVFKVNAFIALITAAMIVSVLAPGAWNDKMARVAVAFGSTAGGIGIVIALAAVIGKCMLDSGAADRVVRAFLRVLGERQAPLALMGSGYVLAIPVFFDTVFYLLVPLARSLHRRTGKQYLKYILAIAAGGAITHTLVPPTPGPLLMAATLNVDLGVMIMVGALIALPAAIVGVVFADIAQRLMQTPMRPIGNMPEPKPLDDEHLPGLFVSALPVALPVLLISANTILTTYADMEQAAHFEAAEIQDWPEFREQLVAAATQENPTPATLLWQNLPEETQQLLQADEPLDDEQKKTVVESLNAALGNRDFYQEKVWAGVVISPTTRDLLGQNRSRLRRADLERLNRLLLEDSLGAGENEMLADHYWETPRRRLAYYSDVFGNANFALLLATVIAVVTLARQRSLGLGQVAEVVETSLMSAGVIILITSAGGAFGAMLQQAQIGDAIQTIFGSSMGGGASGLAYMTLGFLIATLLKIAQGSSTVAMIVGSSMMAAIVGPSQLGFHPVYLAIAIGGGSLVGSWMNDSGFWIFAKMGGLTETEALKSWTIMLCFLGITSFAVACLMSQLVPNF